MVRRFHDALVLCKEGLNMKPEDASVRARLYNNRGVAYNGLGQPILAIGDCSMAHRLSPTMWQPLYNRHMAYVAIGATTDAIKVSLVSLSLLLEQLTELKRYCANEYTCLVCSSALVVSTWLTCRAFDMVRPLNTICRISTWSSKWVIL